MTLADTEAVRALFLEQATAETAHDLDALRGMFASTAPAQPDPVSFVARAYRFWGKDEVLEHFRQTFAGTWRVEPDQSAPRIIPLNRDAIQVYAPARVTIGAPEPPAKTAAFLINEVMIRSPSGWKVAAVIPVPAQLWETHMSLQKVLTCCAALVVMSAAHGEAPHRFTDEDRQAVEAVFIRQAEAATAHDIDAFAGVLASQPAGEPDPIVIVARSYHFWGRPALIEHFKEIFKGVWKFEPDVTKIRVVPLSADVAQLYAPTRVTAGASEATAKTASFLVYETAVRTDDGWRIASIVPVPAR